MPEVIKRVFRWFRRKFHNDLYEKIDALRSDLNAVLQIQAQVPVQAPIQTQAQNDRLSDYLDAILNNQIALASPAERLALHTPWRERKFFTLERTPEGELCFRRPVAPKKKKKIFVTSIPKSGTNFVSVILGHLGWEGIGKGRGQGFGVYSHAYEDHCGLTLQEIARSPHLAVRLPYSGQINLVQPGQILLGHLNDYRAITDAKLLGLTQLLVIVRDLRHVCVSHKRHILHWHKAKILKENILNTKVTSEQMLDYFANPLECQSIAIISKVCGELKSDPIAHFVRYEELTSHDRNIMEPSLRSIAKVTDCSEDEVFDAAEKAEGQETMTFFKQHSALKGVWNDEVEALFKSYGLDVLNEQLGYSRDYIPED